MNLEVHPEAALDRALAGDLSEAEERVLSQHLATCRACEAHLALARSRQEARTPQPWGRHLDSLAVDCALDYFERRRWSTLFFLPGRRRWLLATAGMLMAVGSVASAAWFHGRRAASEPILAQVTAARLPTRMPSRPALALAETPESPQPEITDEGSIPTRTPRARPSAASLFEQASALRDRNRVDEAIAVFRKLQQLFPSTREARISFAVAGRMLLDRGRPAQALAQFDQHLAHGGEAPEAALAGRATALGQMGRSSLERAAWQRVLDSYPGTVYASQAKERLAQMHRPQEAALGTEHSR
ncbi:MAG: tetratricopeptide repeat protein [Polyangia bacterium]